MCVCADVRLGARVSRELWDSEAVLQVHAGRGNVALLRYRAALDRTGSYVLFIVLSIVLYVNFFILYNLYLFSFVCLYVAESCNRWLHQLQREVGCDDEDPRRQMQGIVYE